MVKDRAAPFSKKHRKIWIPITGGMLLIGAVNLAIGFYMYSNRPESAPRTRPPSTPPWRTTEPAQDPQAGRDAGIDAPERLTPR